MKIKCYKTTHYITLHFKARYLVLLLLGAKFHGTTGSWKSRRNQKTYSWSMFCAVNCWPRASNFQVSHLMWGQEPNSDLKGGRRECYHSATVAPLVSNMILNLIVGPMTCYLRMIIIWLGYSMTHSPVVCIIFNVWSRKKQIKISHFLVTCLLNNVWFCIYFCFWRN